MTQEEFTRRFVAAVVTKSFEYRKLPFNRDPADYAAHVVSNYWVEYLQHGGTPERFADEDAQYWE